MSDYLVEAKNICKTFTKAQNKLEILKGLDIQVKRGESISIVGASGVGKSTLLHILGTLDEPTSGEIYYESSLISKYSKKQLCKFRNESIGFIFQFHYLFRELSALENVMLPALMFGLGKKEASLKAKQILEEVSLHGRMEHKPGELSGGEQQRVAIARSIIMSPKIIYADEPTGNLDPDTGESVFNLLLGLNKSHNVTLVTVTHNQKLASLTDRTLRIRKGKIENFK
ncbi:MAG: ABC transporter ATP-binding protein [Pseudomonadota bacterium]